MQVNYSQFTVGPRTDSRQIATTIFYAHVFKLGVALRQGTSGTVYEIPGTSLSCAVDSTNFRWEDRMDYLVNMAGYVLHYYDRQYPLLLFSLGSASLLVEFILGSFLLKQGYQVYFRLIDPVYACSQNLEWVPETWKLHEDFIQQMKASVSDQPFSEDRILFLSDAKKVNQCKPIDSQIVNALVMESFPPSYALFRSMAEKQCKEKKVHKIISGSAFVEKKEANSIAFIPEYLYPSLKESLLRDTSLRMPFIKDNDGRIFPHDWGCKVYMNGTAITTFSGVPKEIKNTLKADIGTLLSKKEKKSPSEILEAVKSVVKKAIPNIRTLYLSDYWIDRQEMMQQIFSIRGLNSAVGFCLADQIRRYEVRTELFTTS